MKIRYKILDLRRQRDAYMAYALDPGGALEMEDRLRLCAEMARLQKVIEAMEALPISALDSDDGDFNIQKTTEWK